MDSQSHQLINKCKRLFLSVVPVILFELQFNLIFRYSGIRNSLAFNHFNWL